MKTKCHSAVALQKPAASALPLTFWDRFNQCGQTDANGCCIGLESDWCERTGQTLLLFWIPLLKNLDRVVIWLLVELLGSVDFTVRIKIEDIALPQNSRILLRRKFDLQLKPKI